MKKKIFLADLKWKITEMENIFSDFNLDKYTQVTMTTVKSLKLMQYFLYVSLTVKSIFKDEKMSENL